MKKILKYLNFELSLKYLSIQLIESIVLGIM